MSRADKILEFIRRYIRTPDGAMVGSPLELLPFQVDFIRAVFDNPKGTTKRAILSVARKQGKTTLIAALLLCFLVGPEATANAQIISAAMSREQAAIVFRLACQMVRLSPELSDLVRITESRREMHGLPMGTTYRAIAAEAGTAHGMSPLLCILDEAGQIKGPHSDFVSALTTSQGAHARPLFVTISTQAADPSDLLSTWIDSALDSKDSHVVCHLHAAPENCALDDLDAIRAANPALGQFRNEADVLQLAAEAKRLPAAEPAYRNLILNQRVATTAPFMSRSVWESCGKPSEYLDGLEVYGGLDLSARTDLIAFVLIGRDQQGTWHIQPHFWTPEKGLIGRARRDRQPYDLWVEQGFMRTTPGATVDYAQVAQDIAEITEGLNVQGIAFDRWRIHELQKEFEKIGLTLPLIEHGQGFKDMSPALDAVEAEFLNARVRHGMHPVLTMCAAGAVVTRDPAGNRKLDKSKATCRIDGLQSMAMAFGLASKCIEAVRAPEYQMIFV